MNKKNGLKYHFLFLNPSNLTQKRLNLL